MVTGRPPLFSTVEELNNAIESYFEWIKGNAQGTVKPQPPTITGLALYLGFASRQSFYDYEKDGEFSYTIKKARLKIECEYEKALHSNSPTGAIFALKNFGWKDKQEVEQNTTINGEIKHTIDHSKLSDAALREIAALDKPKEGEN